MGWGFGRSQKDGESSRDGQAVSGGPSRSSGLEGSDPTAELRVRARRRLIGAAALLLAVVVIVPAVLDPVPAPLPNTIPIEIPEENTAFTPRLSLPPLPEPADDPSVLGAEAELTAPATDNDMPSPPSGALPDSDDSASNVPQNGPDKKNDDQIRAEDAKHAQALLEGRDSGQPLVSPPKKYALQVAATSSLASARSLAKRLSESGFKSYVTEFESDSSLRFRVRIGPYTSLDEAEQVRARLRAKGHKANLVTL